jgi:hypothetical protein
MERANAVSATPIPRASAQPVTLIFLFHTSSETIPFTLPAACIINFSLSAPSNIVLSILGQPHEVIAISASLIRFLISSGCGFVFL